MQRKRNVKQNLNIHVKFELEFDEVNKIQTEGLLHQGE